MAAFEPPSEPPAPAGSPPNPGAVRDPWVVGPAGASETWTPADWAAAAGSPGGRRRRGRLSPARRAVVSILTVAAVLVGPGLVGYQYAHDRAVSDSAAPTATVVPSRGFEPGTGGLTLPGELDDSRPTGATSGARLDVSTVSDKVDDSVVSVWVTTDEGQGAGTGIVVSSDGLIITNNHVIADSRDVQVEFVTTGQTRTAKVLGYSVARDIALLQVQGSATVKPAELGSSESLAVGDPILALGNAGGQGGLPMVVSGSVTAKNQQITASDEDGSNVQTLTGLVQTDANIQPGDSGGPLIDRAGRVVGVNAAASSANGTYSYGGRSQNQGYAIPMERALQIANDILAGNRGPDLHVGPNRGVLGVQISSSSRTSSSGASVLGTDPTGGAAKAGIVAGDTIVGLEDVTIGSGGDLTRALVPYNPGEKVQVTWVDRSGNTRRATITLGSGPPA